MGGKIALQVAADDALRDRRGRQLILVALSPPTVERMPEDEKERTLRHPDRGEAEPTMKEATQQPLPTGRHGAYRRKAVVCRLNRRRNLPRPMSENGRAFLVRARFKATVS